MMQQAADWKTGQRVLTFDYLNGEPDYSLANDLNISDFKSPFQIRDPNNPYDRVDFQDEKILSEFIAESRILNTATIERRDTDPILRLIWRNGNTRQIVHSMDSLTSNGTWASDTAASDATTLAQDAVRYKTGSASLKFNIDVSQSANNYAAIVNSTLTAVDLTDYENVAHFRAWLDLQQMTTANLALISSVELRWGSNASNYWYSQKSTTVNAGSFKAQWNRIDWDWETASKFGTPNVTAITYLALIINYGAGMTDTSNVRWDELVCFLPRELEFVYYSTCLVQTAAGVWQEEFTSDDISVATERLLLPTRHRKAFVDIASEYLIKQMKDEDSQAYLYYQAQGMLGYKRMLQELGTPIRRPMAQVLPRGNSSGRIVSRQW
jgi:hypothetical protein